MAGAPPSPRAASAVKNGTARDRNLRAKPRTYRAVVEAGGIELALPPS